MGSKAYQNACRLIVGTFTSWKRVPEEYHSAESTDGIGSFSKPWPPRDLMT